MYKPPPPPFINDQDRSSYLKLASLPDSLDIPIIMPDPAVLPSELFGVVLDFALHKSKPGRLSSLALLNRKWYAALLGRIYCEWRYDGTWQSFTALLKFLRTVRNNMHIAQLVRTLNVGYCGTAANPPSPISLPAEETEWIRCAVHDVGLAKLEDSIFQSLSQQDRRPLMAILLASVPNLSTLYACVPRLDPTMGAILKTTLQGDISSPLRMLKELYLFAEHPLWGDSDDDSQDESRESLLDDPESELPRFDLEYLWPVFFLPNLRTLLLYNLDPRKAADYLGQHDAECGVENLSLIGCGLNGIFTISDFEAFVLRTGMLKNFALYNPPEGRLSEFSNAHLWNCLQKHKDTLKTIDICVNIFGPAPMLEMGHCGLFCDFTSLEDLRINTDTLLGGCIGSPLAPFRLRDTLPETIKALTLYGEQGYLAVPDMPKQLQELLGEDFPSLRSLTLEKFDSITHGNGEMKDPYQKLGERCFDKGIVFRIEQGDQLSKGNMREALWGKTIYIGADEPSDYDKDEAGDSDSEDEYGPFMSGILKFHKIPFTDHRGVTAFMVFQNLEPFPLPPLFSFAIYFTHSHASPESTNVVGFFQEIHACNEDRFDVRFDMYFLPSATHRDCVQHYQEEKASRGTYEDQLRMFRHVDRDQVYPLPRRPNKVPGMVKKYHNAGQVLFICSDEDWQESQHALTVLKFARSSSTEVMEYRVIEDCPMTQESPSYDPDATSQLIIENDMFFWAHRDREKFLGPWQKATSRGWKGW